MESTSASTVLSEFGTPATVLVIGAAGFVGRHLLSSLAADPALSVCATKLAFETMDLTPFPSVRVYDLDITENGTTEKLLEVLRPDVIYHLAAQSSVALSFQKAELTMRINVLGSLHVMEAVRAVCPNCAVLFIGSAEQYGPVPPELQPVKETTHLAPVSPYAISKMTVEAMATLYAKSYGLHFRMIRAFNHIGPGQLPLFVVSDFARQIVRIEKGLEEPVMRVGNLSARRDFTDVRDIVRGYRLLAEKGRDGEVYNIGSGHSVPIRAVLDLLLSLSGTSIEVVPDPAKFRPVDVPEFVADITKLREDTGWQPIIPIETSLSDVLEYWRLNV